MRLLTTGNVWPWRGCGWRCWSSRLTKVLGVLKQLCSPANYVPFSAGTLPVMNYLSFDGVMNMMVVVVVVPLRLLYVHAHQHPFLFAPCSLKKKKKSTDQLTKLPYHIKHVLICTKHILFVTILAGVWKREREFVCLCPFLCLCEGERFIVWW